MALSRSATGSNSFCRPCQAQGRGFTETVLDHSTGDLICTTCGLVLQGRCIDEAAEWRNFETDSVDLGMKFNEKQRGGGTDGQIDKMTGSLPSTSFSGSCAGFESLGKFQSMVDTQSLSLTLSSSDRMSKNVTSKLTDYAKSAQLTESTLQRCLKFVNHLAEKNQLGKQHDVPWYYAIVYLACREERTSQTTRELAAAGFPSSSSGSEDEFEKQMRKKIKSLERPQALGTLLRAAKKSYIQPQELVPRFVSKLSLSRQVEQPAMVIAQNARKYKILELGSLKDGETEQIAVIAGAIFMATHLLCGDAANLSLSDVAIVAKIPEVTVRAVYGCMRSHYKQALLPEDFKERLQNGMLPELPSAKDPTPRRPEVPTVRTAAILAS